MLTTLFVLPTMAKKVPKFGNVFSDIERNVIEGYEYTARIGKRRTTKKNKVKVRIKFPDGSLVEAKTIIRGRKRRINYIVPEVQETTTAILAIEGGKLGAETFPIVIYDSEDILSQGLEGAQGIQGEQGLQGEKGQDGLNGTNGIDGLNGVDGKDGLNGTDGKNGLDGKDGLNGQDGKDGKNGVDGINGADGRDGVDGKNGVDGQDGKDGADGIDGTSIVNGSVVNGELSFGMSNGSVLLVDGNIQGADGVDGTDGKEGAQGLQGKQGIQGPAGPQGPQGIAGNDGVDGVGIVKAELNPVNGDFNIHYSNGSTQLVGQLNSLNDVNIVEGNLVVKINETIKVLGRVVGEQGPAGPQGPQGPAGPSGSSDFKDGNAFLTPEIIKTSTVTKREDFTIKNRLHFGGDSAAWQDHGRLDVNHDPLTICRVNVSENKTELRFVIADDFGQNKNISDTFVVGANDPVSLNYNKIFEVDSEDQGKVRIPSLKGGLNAGKCLSTDSVGNIVLVKCKIYN